MFDMKINGFNNQNIRRKLSLFLILPVIAVLFFSYSVIHSKYQQSNAIRHVERLIGINYILADLTHEMQNERGLSIAYISSNKNKFNAELKKQRDMTDRVVHELRNALNTFEYDRYFAVANELMQLASTLSKLYLVRNDVDKANDKGVFQYYSRLNYLALSFIQYSGWSSDMPTSEFYKSFTVLLWLQERASQERGVLSGVFESGVLDAASLRKLSFYVLDQQRLLTDYYDVAPEGQAKRLDEKMGLPVIYEVSDIRSAVMSKAQKNDLLNELQRQLGFGGLIHDFKNYILRNDQAYKDQFEKKLANAINIIKQYRNIKGITKREKAYLDQLEDNIAQYAKNIIKAQKLKNEGATTNIIDQAVKVNDMPAVRALRGLHMVMVDVDARDWWEKSTLRIEIIRGINEENRKNIIGMVGNMRSAAIGSLLLNVVVVVLVIVVSSILAWLLIRRLVYDVKHISRSIRKMQVDGNYNSLLDLPGQDEISEMANAFDDLIRERKKSEAEQSRLYKELQQAHKMESLGLMTGGIAHDFNNILATIIGYSELGEEFSQTAREAKLKGYFSEILKAGCRGKDLIAQMMCFSRQQDISDQPIHISALLKEDIKLLRSMLPSSINFNVFVADDLPKIMMNSTQLNQILLNLAVNARDAMDGHGELTFRAALLKNVNAECAASHKAITGDWVAISISDTGSGINPDIIENIFDPFYTTKDVDKGTGMGLSVVYGIVRSHNGYILLDSTVGQGTTFSLLFPPCDGSDLDGDAQKDLSVNLNMDGGGETILVLDDEETLANFVAELLQLNGYTVNKFVDSGKALAAFKSEPARYAAIITDQTMPYMTGVEFIQAIRHIKDELPIILCTGFSDAINGERAKLMNVCYLEKPVKSYELLKKVREALGKGLNT